MLESINFIYDGVHSKDMGVSLANTDGGLFQDLFFPETSIIEKKTTGRDKPYFQRVERDSLSFDLTLLVEDYTQIGHMRSIARWLFRDFYKPLIFESNPNRIFYAMIEGSSSLNHAGDSSGYIEVSIYCNSPYAYTPEYNLENVEFRGDNEGVLIENGTIDFNEGEHVNTEVLDNGLTVKSNTEKWGDVYAIYGKWGELQNGE